MRSCEGRSPGPKKKIWTPAFAEVLKCQRACKPGSVLRRSFRVGGCAAIPLGRDLRRGSSNQPGRRAGTRLMRRPYSVLHPVGFTVPALLPGPRCALAAPFRPYPSETGRYAFCGTVPDPPSPRLWRTAGRYPAPWFHGARTFLGLLAKPAAARPSGPRNMGYCGRGSNKESNFARHSPSMTPSMRSGRNRRWKAITALSASVTS